MTGNSHLTTWIGDELKARFTAIATYQDLTPSALLKRMVELTVQANSAGIAQARSAPLAQRTGEGPGVRETERRSGEALWLAHEALLG